MATILVATDGSAPARAALRCAVELAGVTGDGLLAVTVWRALQGDFGLPYPSSAVLEDLLDSEREHATQTLREAETAARAAGIEVGTLLLTGDPAEEICKVAVEREARMIAIGTHGHGIVSLLVGSVSAAVIRHAPCPVLVVPDPERRAATPRRSRLFSQA